MSDSSLTQDFKAFTQESSRSEGKKLKHLEPWAPKASTALANSFITCLDLKPQTSDPARHLSDFQAHHNNPHSQKPWNHQRETRAFLRLPKGRIHILADPGLNPDLDWHDQLNPLMALVARHEHHWGCGRVAAQFDFFALIRLQRVNHIGSVKG